MGQSLLPRNSTPSPETQRLEDLVLATRGEWPIQREGPGAPSHDPGASLISTTQMWQLRLFLLSQFSEPLSPSNAFLFSLIPDNSNFIAYLTETPNNLELK